MVQAVVAGRLSPPPVHMSIKHQLQKLGERIRPSVRRHGHDRRNVLTFRAPRPRDDVLIQELICKAPQGNAHAARVVHETPHVVQHRSFAIFRRARVARPEAVALQEAAQRDVVAPVEVHVHHPGVDAERGCVVRLRTEAAEEDRQSLVVRGVEHLESVWGGD